MAFKWDLTPSLVNIDWSLHISFLLGKWYSHLYNYRVGEVLGTTTLLFIKNPNRVADKLGGLIIKPDVSMMSPRGEQINTIYTFPHNTASIGSGGEGN